MRSFVENLRQLGEWKKVSVAMLEVNTRVAEASGGRHKRKVRFARRGMDMSSEGGKTVLICGRGVRLFPHGRARQSGDRTERGLRGIETEAKILVGVGREDVGRLIKQGPKEQLDLTTNTQPVMLTAGIACYRAWLADTGLVPSVVAGHSLGEYSALVAAGALTLADALPLVRFRAQAMHNFVDVSLDVALKGADIRDAPEFIDPDHVLGLRVFRFLPGRGGGQVGG